MADATAHAARSQLQIGAEATFKTISSSLTAVPFISNGLAEAGDLQTRQIIAGGPLPAAPYKPNRLSQGDIVIPWDVTYLQSWLTLLFGAPTGTLWEFDSNMSPFSVVRQYPNISHREAFTGCKCSRMSLNWQRGQELTLALGVIAAKRAWAASDSVTSPAISSLFEASDLALAIDSGAYAKASQFSLDIDFALDSSIYVIGSGDNELADIPQGVAQITGSWTALLDNDDLQDQAETEVELDITLTNAALGTWAINLPIVQHSRPSVSIDGPGGIMQTVNFVAYTDNPGNAAMSIEYTAPA